MTELLTARLSLQRPAPADIDDIYRIHCHPEACAHNPSDLLGTRDEADQLYGRWDASARVAVRAGLRRAEHLDTEGEDGLDWIYVGGPDEVPR
jgi:hypothetical protein